MRLSGCDDGRDDGSIVLLVVAYTAIAMLLVVAGIDVSKVFLAQRALSSAADAAAVAGAEGVDTSQIYDGAALRCGGFLPLDPADAAARAQADIADESPDLAHSFASLDVPRTSVTGATVTVTLRGQVHLPFGGLLRWLGITASGGAVPVGASASATSPVAGSAATC